MFSSERHAPMTNRAENKTARNALLDILYDLLTMGASPQSQARIKSFIDLFKKPENKIHVPANDYLGAQKALEKILVDLLTKNLTLDLNSTIFPQVSQKVDTLYNQAQASKINKQHKISKQK